MLLLSSLQRPAASCPLHCHLPGLGCVMSHCSSTMVSLSVPSSALAFLSAVCLSGEAGVDRPWFSSSLSFLQSFLTPHLRNTTCSDHPVGKSSLLCPTPFLARPSLLPLRFAPEFSHSCCLCFLFPVSLLSLGYTLY